MLDYYLAPGVLNSFKKNLKRNMKYLLEDNNAPYLDEYTWMIEELDTINVVDYSDFFKKLSEMVSMQLSEDNAEKIIKRALDRAETETDRDTYQAMEALIHNLNTMHSRAGAQTPFVSISFGTDTSPEGRMVMKNFLLATEAGLGNGETAIFPISIFKVKEGVNYFEDDPNYDLFKLACKVSAKRLFPNFAFLDAPFNKKYYVEGRPETEAVYMG